MSLKRPAAAVKVEADDGRRGRGTGAARAPVAGGDLPFLPEGHGISLDPLFLDDGEAPWGTWAAELGQRTLHDVALRGRRVRLAGAGSICGCPQCTAFLAGSRALGGASVCADAAVRRVECCLVPTADGGPEAEVTVSVNLPIMRVDGGVGTTTTTPELGAAIAFPGLVTATGQWWEAMIGEGVSTASPSTWNLLVEQHLQPGAYASVPISCDVLCCDVMRCDAM